MPVVDRPVVPARTSLRSRRRVVSALAAGLALVAAASACTDADGVEDDRLVLEVGGAPPAGDEGQVEVWERRIAQFEAAHPDIRVDSSEITYSPEDFRVRLAAGDLPDVLLVPYTEPQALIRRGELAEIGDELAAVGVDEVLNESLQRVVTDGDGSVYGVPVSGYSMGLVYNRAVFTEAGLDPDAPPRTWDEVRAAARQIADRTDAAGFAHMGSKNFGGFALTAETYSFGGRAQDETTGALTLTDGPMAAALEVLQAMRWVDGSTDRETSHTSETVARSLAAGRVGMYVAAPDVYGTVVGDFGLPREDFGMGALPRGTDGERYATLAGGTVAVVSPDADADVREAAVRWIEFAHLDRYVDREAALAEAEALRGSRVYLGVPGLPPVKADVYRQWEEWVAGDVDVLLDNFAGYTEALTSEEAAPEPGVEAQLVYKALDDVVQAVLGREGTDIDRLLAETQEQLAVDIERG